MASDKFHSYINYFIIIVTPIIICATILVGVKDTLQFLGFNIPTPDYINYYMDDWNAVFTGQNPYYYFDPMVGDWVGCLYPPGFLVFSVFYRIYPLLPKVVFCLIWIFTGLYINKLCKKYNTSRKSTIYYTLALHVAHPLYWGIIIISGHYDVAVGLCVLLAVYCMDKGEQIKSAMYSAFAFLLKFIGLILIFPLVFLKKKINWRAGVVFVAICGGVYLLGYLFWGAYVFDPILVHIFRDPEGGSIFTIISQFLGIGISTMMLALLIGGMIIVAIFLYWQNTDVASFSLILILLFLLILPVIWIHYAAWFLPLTIYWSLTHNGRLQGTIFYYHMGGLVACLSYQMLLDQGLGWVGSLIYFIITLIFVLIIFLYRKKGTDQKKEAE